MRNPCGNHKLPLEHRGTTRHVQLPVERLRQLHAIRSFTEALRLKKSLRTLTRLGPPAPPYNDFDEEDVERLRKAPEKTVILSISPPQPPYHP